MLICYGHRTKGVAEGLLSHVDGIVLGLLQLNSGKSECAGLPRGPIVEVLEELAVSLPIFVVLLASDDEVINV